MSKKRGNEPGPREPLTHAEDRILGPAGVWVSKFDDKLRCGNCGRAFMYHEVKAPHECPENPNDPWLEPKHQ